MRTQLLVMVAVFALPLFAEDSFVRESFALRAPKVKPSLVYREKPALRVPLISADAPALDGRLSAKCWETAPAMLLSDATRTDENAPHSVALLFFGSDALFVGCICPLPLEKFDGKSPEQIDELLRSLSASSKHDWDVWQDESIELFVDPGHSTSRYFQFIVNTLNTQQESEGFTTTWNGAWSSKVHVVAQEAAPLPDGIAHRADLGLSKLTRFYWTCEVAIPYSTFGLTTPKPGEAWGFNAVRNEKLTGKDYTWAHVRLNNHEPASFGQLQCVSSVTNPRFGALWSAPPPLPGINRFRCALAGADFNGIEVRCSASGPDGAKQAAAKLDSAAGASMEFPISAAGRYDVALSIHKIGAAEAFDTARFTCEYEPPAKAMQLKLEDKSYFVSERALRAKVILASLGEKNELPAEFILKSDAGTELNRGSLSLKQAATEVEFDVSSLKAGTYTLVVSAGGQQQQQTFSRIAGPFDE